MDDITLSPQLMEAQLDELVRDMLALQPRREEVTVRDPEGQVAATIDPEGRLARVLVEPRWVDKIETDHLANAILATIAEAQLEASGLSGDAPVITDEQVAAKRQEILRQAENELQAPTPEGELQAKIDNLPNLFDRLDDALQRLEDRATELETPIPLEEAAALGLTEAPMGEQIRSENSMVSLTVNPEGGVVDVSIHRNWLEGKSGIAVTECLDQIISQMTDQPIS